jgi:hypothetical protein
MKQVWQGFVGFAGLFMFMHGMVLVQSTWGLGATWIAGFVSLILFMVGLVLYASYLDASDARQIK